MSVESLEGGVPSISNLPGRRVLVVLAALAAVGLVGGYGVAMRARPRSTKIALSTGSPADRNVKQIYVHVGGAVRTPGLYQVGDGSRVHDAIRAAGGPTDEADLDALNLAAKVKDGDKVLVPRKAQPGEAVAPVGAGAVAQPGAPGALVNLNSATAAELDALPGVGPSTAEKIIAYRTEHGGFRTIDELMDVPGIGPAKFEELKDLVTV